MRTTILAAFFYLIGFSCASMLAFILYLTRYGKDMEVARSDLDYSIKLLRRGAIMQNSLGFSDRKQIDIADKVADLQKTRPDVVSTVAATCKRPSVRPGIAGRGNSHSSRPPEAIKETNNSAQQTKDRHKQFVRMSVKSHKTKRSRLPVVEDGLDRVDTDGHRQATGDQCAPKKHFVWIKVHKAGSQTTNPIFERFAYKHQLKFTAPNINTNTSYLPPIVLFPAIVWYLQRADCVLAAASEMGEYVHPPTGGPFDALYVHSRYNKTWMQAHFPNDTVYLSIVKDPFSHFKSSFHYYGLPQHLNLQDWNPVKTFLKNPWKYKTEALYQGIRFDKTRNAQLFDLGFPIEKSHDRIWAEEYIKQLDRDFLLVIILEHYAESLVLLKRLMCWELSDILLVEERINSRSYRYKHYSPTREELKRYKMYAEAEYVMYQRFNQSLWTKIGQQSQDFFQEVENYKQVTRRVRTFCKYNSTQELLISASPWNPQYKMRQSICTYLKIHDIEWRTHSWAQLRYPPRIKRLLRQEYFNNISKYHDKLLAAARQDSAENKRS
ncbi:galactose-3-O-sulfotransferase 1 [Branchiostoma belcheri]|nr:galactose-3-O-sulfotransferase 1 [Branchiostoma belcheri]